MNKHDSHLSVGCLRGRRPTAELLASKGKFYYHKRRKLPKGDMKSQLRRVFRIWNWNKKM